MKIPYDRTKIHEIIPTGSGDMDDIPDGTTYVKTENNFTDAEQTKLSGIETGAEVNNISDANATDLTDGGATILHKHSYNNLDDLPTIPTSADYESKFVAEIIGSGDLYSIIGNTNVIVYHIGDENASVVFPIDTGLPSGTFVRVKVVNIPATYTVTLDFADKLNWNPQTTSGENNIVLTDTDIGSAFTFIFVDLDGSEKWWYELL